MTQFEAVPFAVVFAGIGTQWVGMARELLEANKDFQAGFREFSLPFQALAGWSVENALAGADERMLSAAKGHPSILAVEFGLLRMVQARGFTPALYMGHSGGEVAAAWGAGVLSARDAALLALHHSTVLEQAAGSGRMLHFSLPAAAVQDIIAPYSGVVRIAAINSPTSTVCSGDGDALEELAASYAENTRFLRINVPFHSPGVSPWLDTFAERIAALVPAAPHTSLVSSLHGGLISANAPLLSGNFDASYWRRHISEPVQFESAVKRALQCGIRHFVELSPHAVLQASLAESARAEGLVVQSTGSLVRGGNSCKDMELNLHLLSGWAGESRNSAPRKGLPHPDPALRNGQAQYSCPATNSGDLISGCGASVGSFAVTGEGLALSRLPLTERLSALQNHVLAAVTSLFSIGAGDSEEAGSAEKTLAEKRKLIEPEVAEASFQSLGVTSLLATRLRTAMAELLGLALPVSIIFNYPDARSLARHLSDLLLAETGGAALGDKVLAREDSSAPHERISENSVGAHQRDEPIAVVGTACRFPGGIRNMDEYWEFIKGGGDAVIPIPAERWDKDCYYDPDRDAPGKMYTREAAFLTTPIDRFDPFFFNISAREAVQLDPQQRLLLELSWEAFEDAGIDPARWRERQAGVFLAMTNNEYSRAHRDSFYRERIDAYSLTGTTSSAAAGRLSYFYGFEGPCWSVDTACSSGLVALHCACQSLHSGESNLALVGGVTLMLTPDLHICFTKLGAISPDGRSKAFDDGANGYGRGEGGAVVLLKRLCDAERDGDRILGLIVGTCINQDGKSNGLTAPNGLAQQKVIAGALRAARLPAQAVSYVEAHGTGTALGDSIELDSLAAAYCADRSAGEPLLIGSVKANIGHLEPAAALASLLKILLCLRHRTIPANIHITRPNTRFDFTKNAVEAPTGPVPWKREGVLRAGMNAFGFSGINGHAVVEEYQKSQLSEAAAEQVNTAALVQMDEATITQSGKVSLRAAACVEPPAAFVLPLSGKTPEALRDLALACAARIPSLSLEELGAMCRIFACKRSHFTYRLAVVGRTAEELVASLQAGVQGEPQVGAFAQGATASGNGLALLFTGQGSQYPGMGKELYYSYPVFRQALDRCAGIVQGHGIALLPLLFGDTSARELERTSLAQPLIVSVSYALWQLWESFGLRFSATAGHSIGEYPAAVAAGILSLEDMLRLAVLRGKAMESAPAGIMAAIFIAEEMLLQLLQEFPQVVLAAVNAPQNCVVSGPEQAVEALLQTLASHGVSFKKLRVSRPFHSPDMQGAAEIFGVSLANVSFIAPDADAAGKVFTAPDEYSVGESYGVPRRMRFVSSMAGEGGSPTASAYWIRQITAPVHFSRAVQVLAEGHSLAVEAGPSAALSGLVEQCETGLRSFPSAAPGHEGLFTLFSSVARLFEAGLALHWEAVCLPFSHQHVTVPGYPFQRERHWMPVVNELPATPGHRALAGGGRADRPSAAGERLSSPALGETVVFQSVFSDAGPHFLHEHIIFGKAISPAAGHMAMVLAAAQALRGQRPCELHSVDFLNPLVVEQGEQRLVQVILDAPARAESFFRLVSRRMQTLEHEGMEQDWLVHCTGELVWHTQNAPQVAFAVEDFFEQERSKSSFYDHFVKSGYTVGEGFQRIERISTQHSQAHCLVQLRRGTPGEAGHVIYPGALDSVLQTIIAPYLAMLSQLMTKEGSLLIPLHLARLSLWKPMPDVLWCRAETEPPAEGSVLQGSTLGVDAQGDAVLELAGFVFRMTDSATLYRNLMVDPQERLYVEQWELEKQWDSSPPSVLAAKALENGALAEILVVPFGDGALARSLAALPGVRLFSGELPLAAYLEQSIAPRVLLAAHSFTEAGPEAVLHQEHADCANFLELLQTVAGSAVPPRLYLATRQGFALHGRDAQIISGGVAIPSGAGLWGLADSFALEHPDVIGGLMDLAVHEPGEARKTGEIDSASVSAGAMLSHGEGSSTADLAALLARVRSQQSFRGALRQGAMYTCRLARVQRLGAGRTPDFSGTHFITGGSGALGLQTAEWLAEQGATALGLFSRRGALAGAALTVVEALRERGVRVFELQGDVTNLADIEAALGELRRQAGPLRGVFHAAGVLDDGVVSGLTSQRLRDVMRPKVDGALYLHRATCGDELAHFVCYSSAGTLLGSAGQANYNAANHFLNAFVRWRRAQGLAAASPCWGPWAEGGMAGVTQSREENLSRQGIVSMRGKDAFASFAAAQVLDDPVFAVMTMDWKRFLALREYSADGYFSLLVPPNSAAGIREGQEKSGGQGHATEQSAGLLARAYDKNIATFDFSSLVQGLQEIAAQILGLANSTVLALDKPLLDYGFDSLMAVAFRTKVSRELGRPIPVSLIFELPTLQKMAEWLCEREKKSSQASAGSLASAGVPGGSVSSGRLAGASGSGISGDSDSLRVGKSSAASAGEARAPRSVLDDIDSLLGE